MKRAINAVKTALFWTGFVAIVCLVCFGMGQAHKDMKAWETRNKEEWKEFQLELARARSGNETKQ